VDDATLVYRRQLQRGEISAAEYDERVADMRAGVAVVRLMKQLERVAEPDERNSDVEQELRENGFLSPERQVDLANVLKQRRETETKCALEELQRGDASAEDREVAGMRLGIGIGFGLPHNMLGREKAFAATIHIAAKDTLRPQEIRLGTNWLDGSRRARAPRDALFGKQMEQFLRQRAFAELREVTGRGRKPSEPKRSGKEEMRLLRAPKPAEAQAAEEPTPEEVVFARIEGPQLLRALEKIASPKEFAVIRLRLEGFKTADAARQLSMSPSTARQHLFRLNEKRMTRAVRELFQRLIPPGVRRVRTG
jgi:DNA-directed RNA polymerase specialized sigma24 family protein